MAPYRTRGIELLFELIARGFRVFTTAEAIGVAESMGISNSAEVRILLPELLEAGLVERLKKGTYALAANSGLANIPTSYEKASALVPRSAIAYETALFLHGLIDNEPKTIYSIVQTGGKPKRLPIPDGYQFSELSPKHFFGFTEKLVRGASIKLTDPERTLIDGLLQPQRSGGVGQVLDAFRRHKQFLRLPHLIEYANRVTPAARRRLGWCLEHIGIRPEFTEALRSVAFRNTLPLDLSLPDAGAINSRWGISENVPQSLSASKVSVSDLVAHKGPFTKDLSNQLLQAFAEQAIEKIGTNGNDQELHALALDTSAGESAGVIVVHKFWGGLAIPYLLVKKPYRRQGVGRRLIGLAMDYARETQCRFLTAETTNFEGLDFYLKVGFKLEFTRSTYDQGVALHYLRRSCSAD